MNRPGSLVDLLDDSVRLHPEKLAVIVPDKEQISYSGLYHLANRVRDRLRHIGVTRGDRVALYLSKSIAAVASIFGVMKAGAAYVPIGPDAPPDRARYIIQDCGVKAVIADQPLDLTHWWQEHCTAPPVLLTLKEGSCADSLASLLTSLQSEDPAPVAAVNSPEPEDVAYILYTSGSTGKPKGVTLTHANGLSFIKWCEGTFDIRPDDRFSSHAPFHFDLSIFDIYVSIMFGCTLVLIDETLGKQAMRLAEVMSRLRITVWYSTPSILVMLATYGKLRLYDYSGPRLVLFAGEPLAVSKYLHLRKFWPGARCFNLYGPTETNVCTYYEMPTDDRVESMPTIPIGKVCAPNLAAIVDDQDRIIESGQGELVISGPNVMWGYWNLAEKNAVAFLTDADQRKWYRTGDIVAQDPEVGLIYIGRRDRMVKRRGYRIELGDIEAALLGLDSIQEAAVVALPDEESGVRIVAFITQGALGQGGSALKVATQRVLPRYMIPDEFVVVDAIAKTSTNKTDYEHLKRTIGG